MGWSRTLVAGLYTAGSLTAGVAVLFVGRLLDRFGARVMLTAVGVLFGVAAFAMSKVSHPAHLFVGFAALRLMGQGSLGLIATTAIAMWFVRLRGRATAIASLGGTASLAAFPPFVHMVISHMGWRDAWMVLGFVVWGVLLLPAVLLLRRSPESVGLLPDGDSDTERRQVRDFRQTSEINWSLGEAARTRSFWLLLIAGASNALVGTALMFHQISLLASKGLSAGAAAAVFSVIAPLVLLGTFAAGFLSDRIPNRFLIVGGQVLLAVAMLFTNLINAPWLAFIYGGMLGLSSGFLMVTNTVIWPNYYGRAHLGSIRGAATASSVTFAALGPLPFAFLFDLTQSYTSAVMVFLAMPVACAVAALLATPPRKTDS
jgi:MFS family permease